MALDVQRISGTPAKAAARLCNFVTNDAKLLKAHEDYLLSEVKPALKNFESPWVDLFGYASRKGSPTRNMKLSHQRLVSVGSFITTFGMTVNFQTATGFGAEKSGDDPTDNSGYHRAVEVLVYGVTVGSFSLGGTMYLEMTNVKDLDGKVHVRPTTSATSGGKGVQMPGLGSVTGAVLAMVTEVWPFNGYE